MVQDTTNMGKPKRTIRQSPSASKLSRSEVSSTVKAIHVAPVDGEWVVLKVGPTRIRQRFPSQEQAVKFAETVGARQSHLGPGNGTEHAAIVLHHEDGEVIRRGAGGKASPQRSANR